MRDTCGALSPYKPQQKRSLFKQKRWRLEQPAVERKRCNDGKREGCDLRSSQPVNLIVILQSTANFVIIATQKRREHPT